MNIETFDATDRAAWLARRARDVTASTIGCLLDVHDFITPFELWALKTGQIKDDPEETPAMRRGRLLEPVAIEIAREEQPSWTIEPAGLYFRDPAARIGATPDAFATCPHRGRGIVQVKTTSDLVFRQKWRDPVTREIDLPLWIACQAVLEAHLTGSEWACVALLVVGAGLDLHFIDVPVSDRLVVRLRGEVARFWSMIDNGEMMPIDYRRDGAALGRVYREDDGTEADLSDDAEAVTLLDRRKIAREDKSNAEARLEEIDTALKAKLGNAASAYVAPGRGFSWKTHNRAGYEVKPTTFRMFRVNDRR